VASFLLRAPSSIQALADMPLQGRRPVKPTPHHAELAVNLAGTMAVFLVSKWKERSSSNEA
jgi:hypothetical protein